MAVVVLAEQMSPRSGRLDKDSNHSYTRTFQVQTDNPLDGAAQAMLACGIAIGQPYVTLTESDPYAVCIGVSAECQSEDGKTWSATVEYGPRDVRDDVNPLLEPLEVSWSFARFEEIVDKDLQGRAIATSAGEPYDPPVKRDSNRPTLQVVRNERVFVASMAYNFSDCVNATPYITHDIREEPGKVKVSNINATRQYSQWLADNTSDGLGGIYWKVQYSFEWKREGWQADLWNNGLYQKDVNDPTGKLVPIYFQGVPTQNRYPLDKDGYAIDDPSDSSKWIRNEHDIYTAIDFMTAFNF